MSRLIDELKRIVKNGPQAIGFRQGQVVAPRQRLLLAAGLDIDLMKGLYLTGEVKVVPWNVAPYGIEIQLGGMRYLVGVGYRFSLSPKKTIKDVEEIL